jgi:2-keto-4-pentenoate hydratase/2-oxohepta-3-ene-1,7-dioic acid hydratase in catechol pathway
MRHATILDEGRLRVATIVRDRAFAGERRLTMRDVAAGAVDAPLPSDRGVPLAEVVLGPAIPEPGAIYTVGLNYDGPGAAPLPERPLIYGKARTSVGAHRATLTWDRSLTAKVDAECELGVVMGADGAVFGYTIVNDVSSRDPWLDGDQWLLGKSMAGFCPVGPWIVTPDELDVSDLRLGCTINGAPIQDGRTSDMRFSIDEQISFLRRHVELRPGDLIATGTPARLATPPGPERHLEPGDVVTCWIEGIGELTTHVA